MPKVRTHTLIQWKTLTFFQLQSGCSLRSLFLAIISHVGIWTLASISVEPHMLSRPSSRSPRRLAEGSGNGSGELRVLVASTARLSCATSRASRRFSALSSPPRTVVTSD